MKKVFAFILTVIFILLLPFNLLAYNIKSTFFKPEFYKQELTKNNVYEAVINEAISQLFSSENAKQVLENIPFFTFDELKDLLKKIITSSWMQKEVENIINQSFAWLDSEKDIRDIGIKINFAELKNRTKDLVKTKFEEKIKDLKNCSAADLKKFNQHDIKTLICVPAGYTIDVFLKDFKVDELIDEMPDEIDLVKLIKGEVNFGEEPVNETKNTEEVEGTFNNINRVRDLLHLAFSLINYLFIILGLILLLIAALRMNNLRSMFRWLGFNLFLPGLLIFIATMGLHRLLVSNVSKLISQSKLSTVLLETFKNIIMDLGSVTLTNLKIEGMILSTVGIVLIIISFIIKPGKSSALSSVNK